MKSVKAPRDPVPSESAPRSVAPLLKGFQNRMVLGVKAPPPVRSLKDRTGPGFRPPLARATVQLKSRALPGSCCVWLQWPFDRTVLESRCDPRLSRPLARSTIYSVVTSADIP